MGQLGKDGKNAVGIAMGFQNAHRPGEIDILENQGDVYQINRIEETFGRLDIRDVQLEPGSAPFIALPRAFDVLRVDIYPDYPADAGADGTIEAVSTCATNDGDAVRGIRSDEYIQLMRNELRLTDRRQRHVCLIVGQRNVEPGIVHRKLFPIARASRNGGQFRIADVVGAVNILSRGMRLLRDAGQDTDDASSGCECTAQIACGDTSPARGASAQEPLRSESA